MTTKAVTAYTVIDTITGRGLGVWHSVSERGAKSQAAKALHTEYRYLSAVPFVSIPEEPKAIYAEGHKLGLHTVNPLNWANLGCTNCAPVEVPVFEFETADPEATKEELWIETSWGDESDHWTRTHYAGQSRDEAQAIAREMIATRKANADNITVVVAIPWVPEYPVTASYEGQSFTIGSVTVTGDTVTVRDDRQGGQYSFDTVTGSHAPVEAPREMVIPADSPMFDDFFRDAVTPNYYTRPGFPVEIHGRTYYTAGVMYDRLAALDDQNHWTGASDGRVTEANAIRAALADRD